MGLACQPGTVTRPPVAQSSQPQSAACADEAEQEVFDCRIERYAARCAAVWAEAGNASPEFGATVCPAAKLECEHYADRSLDEIEQMLRRWPASTAKRAIWRHDLLNALRRIAGEYLESDTEGLDRLFTEEALEATRQFIREARAFAPGIAEQSLFQALRNLWVVHSVQLFLRAPIALSPALFAYSMLYPWTDNCLDDLRLTRAAKTAFGDWLGCRLTGVKLAPRDLHAEQVGQLVSMIERLYPRPEFPDVYLSLQAIHRAQMKSLEQQDPSRAWDKQALLHLSIAKGGTSVLADACLVRGSLSADEAEFMFAYGVLLQFMDDLQDLPDDLANGHMTIFTCQARLGPLDGVTTQLWAFTQTVLWNFSRFAAAQPGSLKSLVQDNFRLLLLQTVARNRQFYTRDLVNALEAASPVSFAYLARQEKVLAGRYAQVSASIRQSRRIDSLFELLT
jgi:hypothetical protein